MASYGEYYQDDYGNIIWKNQRIADYEFEYRDERYAESEAPEWAVVDVDDVAFWGQRVKESIAAGDREAAEHCAWRFKQAVANR